MKYPRVACIVRGRRALVAPTAGRPRLDAHGWTPTPTTVPEGGPLFEPLGPPQELDGPRWASGGWAMAQEGGCCVLWRP